MRTVRDLREAFNDLADRAVPAPSDHLLAAQATTGSLTRNRIRVLAPVAAAVATLAVVVSIVLSTDHSGSDGPPAATGPVTTLSPPTTPATDGPPDLRFRFTATQPAGTVPSRSADRAGQTLAFVKPPAGTPCAAGDAACIDARTVAEVTLLYVGPKADPDEASFDIKKIVDRVPVQVAGQSGFYGHRSGSDDPREELFWEYEPGAWAEAFAKTRVTMLALAESVRPTTNSPLDVPLKAALINDQYLNIIQSETSSYGGSFEIATPNAAHGGYLAFWGLQAEPASGQRQTQNPQAATVNGRTWTITGTSQPQADLQGSTVPISIQANYGTSRTQLLAYLKSLTLTANLSNRSTWYDADAVFR